MVSGLIAIAVVSAIGLGCFCNKDKFEGLSNTGPATSPSTAASPSPAATKSYTKADASKAEVPSDDEMQDMVKRTMLDFNAALQKEDFNDFHKSVSKVWQKQITPEKFKESFQDFINGEADFGEISSMQAKFTSPASITKSTGVKTLESRGEYATSPNATEFELKYIAEGKDWKLIGLKVYTNVKRQY
ncbi:MAG TPA: hypothetical protein VIL74_10785 [Pyrinomonadaceae bacterium]|jgi:hypothetical protein